MKKTKVILVILLVFLIILLVFLFLKDKVFSNEVSQSEKDIINSEEKEQLIEDITSDINENDNSNSNDNNINDSDDEKTNDNQKTDKKYDQYFVANGYSGASDNVYYTKDGNLYHLVLSTNKITKIAEGVTKIEDSRGTILVYKGNSFKILKDDNYLTYVD